jgi:hypothetical protein
MFDQLVPQDLHILHACDKVVIVLGSKALQEVV